MKRLFFLFLTFYTTITLAQTNTRWQEALQQWMNSEEMEETFGSDVLEALEETAANPINLNQTSREELELLPFLTAQQVEDIVAYLDHYRPMRSAAELQMITSLDYNTRQLLLHFVTVGSEAPERIWPKFSDIARDGRHTITATGKIPFYEHKGDRNGYLGYKYRHDLRYQFNYKTRIKFGITAAQDAGEPFFANCNTSGYDYYSYYLQLRDFGRLQALNLGMFRVQMGMGLIMNTGFHLGKLATLQSLGRSTHTLTAHASRSASGYLRGAGATIRISPSLHVTAFASYRATDATLNDDGTARTLLSDGYHRTVTEASKKNNTHMTDLGISTGWRKGTLYINANAIYTHLDRRLQPQTVKALYRRYNANGNDFLNASIDYGYNNSRWTIAGETALNRQGALATIHSMSYKMSETVTMMAIHRYYDKQYTSLHARSFSEGSSVQNEHGIYLGTAWRPSWAWLIQGYADYAHFSWPRYQVSAASDAFDTMLSARYTNKRWTADGRYRLHIRQRDNEAKTTVINRFEHRLRLGFNYTINPQWTIRSQADGTSIASSDTNSKGIMLTQQASWQWRMLRASAYVGWFHTDDYDSRIYQYEPSVLYDYSFPLYYGHGCRYALMLRGRLGSHFDLTAKIGVTNYFDRSTIGSGLQQINGSSTTDLLLQLRMLL